MKADIHPTYNKVKLIFPDGTSFYTMSASSQTELYLDVNYLNHPAWTGQIAGFDNRKDGKIGKFNSKFAAYALKDEESPS